VKLTCVQMTEMATDRAEGVLDAGSRTAFDEHLQTCDGCRAYVRQLDVTRQALGRLQAPAISPALSDALMAGFDEWAAKARSTGADLAPSQRFSPLPAIGVLGTIAILVAFARQRSQAPEDWLIGGGLAVAALVASSLAGRFAVGITLAGVAAALAGALVGGRAGALDAAAGVDCLVTELVSALAVGGVAWLAARGGPRPVARSALAAGGVAGALAADAALQLTCRAHGASLHLLAFHLGGVLLVAVASLTLVRPARAPA